MSRRFFIGSDDDGHEFLVPFERREEWEAWLTQLHGPEPDWNQPAYAASIDGGLLTFENPLIR
jgi:hypothetical protein